MRSNWAATADSATGRTSGSSPARAAVRPPAPAAIPGASDAGPPASARDAPAEIAALVRAFDHARELHAWNTSWCSSDRSGSGVRCSVGRGRPHRGCYVGSCDRSDGCASCGNHVPVLLARAPARTLAGHDGAALEDLAAPHAPGLTPLERAGQA